MNYTGNYIIVNGLFVEPDQIPGTSGKNVYEVIRAISGKLLFWEEHLNRLKASLLSVACSFDPDSYPLVHLIKALLARNNIRTINVRIDIIVTENPIFVIGLIPSYYPDPLMYEKGVEMVTLTAERYNPSVKVVQNELKDRVSKILEDKRIYDVLLVDQHNRITEGSKTNVFFIKGKTIFTCPDHYVLSGITRQKVIEICNIKKINVIKEAVLLESIHSFDACFITGTSPKILPVRAINGSVYQTKLPILKILMEAYNLLISNALY